MEPTLCNACGPLGGCPVTGSPVLNEVRAVVEPRFRGGLKGALINARAYLGALGISERHRTAHLKGRFWSSVEDP